MKKNIITGPVIVDNYPYGSLKCKMTFSVEFVKGKGYRSVMQSVNPKNGRENKPKKSTYNHFMYMFKEEETGHIKFAGWNAYGYESVKALEKLLTENDFNLSEVESKELWAFVISCIRGNARYTTVKEGYTIQNFLETTKVSEMIKLYGQNASINELKNVGYNLEEINSMQERF